jgi:hypothetical protein
MRSVLFTCFVVVCCLLFDSSHLNNGSILICFNDFYFSLWCVNFTLSSWFWLNIHIYQPSIKEVVLTVVRLSIYKTVPDVSEQMFLHICKFIFYSCIIKQLMTNFFCCFLKLFLIHMQYEKKIALFNYIYMDNIELWHF